MRLRGYLRSRTLDIAQAVTRAESEPLAEWAVRRIRLDGKPFSFEGHDYLRTIYDDTAPHIVLLKAAQIGGTTWAVLKAFHACVNGLNVMYLFPTRTDVIEFSKSRVGPLLQDNPQLAKRMRETDTAGLKRLGDGFLYLRGMQSSVGLKSVPADMLVFDELDEAPPEAKTMAKERLGHSAYRRIIELSNPSLPDYGIDAVYRQSDQRHWTVRCQSCGTWTAPDKVFPTKLGEAVPIIRASKDDGRYRLVCPRCDTGLNLALGEWVADFPDRDIHGYLISQLHSPIVDPGEILHEYRTTLYPSRFFHLKIGIPWVDLEHRLDAATVLSHCSREPLAEDSDGPCSMGVDTGKLLHVVILKDGLPVSDGFRVVHLCECHDFRDLDVLIRRFRVDRCVIDGMPETHATREFARRHRGVAFLNFFLASQRGVANWDEHRQVVQINRTDALDASRQAFRDGRVVLPRRQPRVEEFAAHMAADAKVLEEDEETGAKRYRYIRTQADHYSLAFTYAWLAATSYSGGRGFLQWIRQQQTEAKADPAESRS